MADAVTTSKIISAVDRLFAKILGQHVVYYCTIRVALGLAIGQQITPLCAVVEQRDGQWISEAFLNVDDAKGMATPDEMVLLHYTSADLATVFRDANQDILEKVGAFNKAHLTDGFPI